MHKPALSIKGWIAVAFAAVAVLLLGISQLPGLNPSRTGTVSRRVGRHLERRLDVLERNVALVREADSAGRMQVGPIPEDMVIYCYENDSLVAWYNQFPLFNDDITSRVAVPRLASSRGRIISPLADLPETYTFINYGPKWYVARLEETGDKILISGLEIANDLSEGYFQGINSRLGAGERCTVKPLSESIGEPVLVHGVPLFNISAEHQNDRGRQTSPFVWLAALSIILAALLFLADGPVWWRYVTVVGFLTVLVLVLYFYGKSLSSSYLFFSPLLYADGPVFCSLGALLLFNLYITLLAACTSLIGPRKGIAPVIAGSAAIVLVCVYLHLTFRSLVMNSSISMEIYKVATLSHYTALVYLSYFLLALAIPLIARIFYPKIMSVTGRVVFSAVAAVYFVSMSSVLGFERERNQVEVWSNRLAMDRDIALELHLRGIDPYLQADSRLAILSAQPGSNMKIHDNLIETYMNRIAQENDISVYLLGEDNSRGVEAIFERRVRGGTPIAENSHFFYSRDNNGRARYTGFFTYYVEGYGSSGLMICVESKANREDRGYLSLLGISEPGRVALPRVYSYAKYVSGRLVTFKGNYAYPTTLGKDETTLPGDGFVHFVRDISQEERIIVSRPKIEFFSYIVAGVIFGLCLFVLISVASIRLRRKARREKSYFRNRINAVLFFSLVLTLVAMAVFSVVFVYRRNEANLRDIMTTKINTLQSVVYARCRFAEDYTDLRTQEIHSALENIGGSLKADITLYSPSGKAFMTTTPEIFDRLIIGTRLDMDVLSSIVSEHKRFVISKERLGTHRYYSLYAPVFNVDGKMVAIIGSPYTDENYELDNEAVSHVATILVVFIILLLTARFLAIGIIRRLFRPLSEMGAKMESADLEHLEYIEYDRDDEVSALVNAYNRMVLDLSDSSRAMAQAERDKAWSSMARQVAHEIKNPLTPIKLQLQILIKMKESGNPAWVEKFDEAAKIVLGHIDILADTANEFSTFAKLYSEDPVPIKIDDLLREEVEMFSSREDIDFSYIGLKNAVISGPKPQLTRVVVNLLTNAVQAIDQRKEGDPSWEGKIVVSLRNSITDGFYDIVFEDNGPGVAEENQDKLFTPNFTTKSRGSGLGLAICRNIIERCGGDIRYSRSFVLGGACFTIRYPK